MIQKLYLILHESYKGGRRKNRAAQPSQIQTTERNRKRMKQRLRADLRAAIPACIVTFLIYLLCGRAYGIFPCGSKSIVWCDMEQQAVPLLQQMKQLLLSGESLRYSLLDAGGMEFYGIFFFFLSNPLSFLALCTDLPADLLVNLLVFVKLSLCAFTAAVWLRHRIPELPASAVVLLSVMYGCSGYGLQYYQNLMWLDIMLMLPLLMLALRRLLYGKGKYRAVPYFLVLCAMMALCFYLCYMIIVFTVLYVGLSLRYTVRAERRGEAARKFWAASISAACVTAVVWIPCFLQVMHSARSSSTVSKLMHAWLVNNLQDKLMLLGCTAIVFAVLPTLFRGADAARRKRDRGLTVLFLLALLFDPVNMMWHTGSYQAFPFRWGLIPVLLLLTRAGEQLSEHSRDSVPAAEPSKKPVLLCLLIMLLVTVSDALLVRFAGKHVTAYVSSLWVTFPQFFLMLIPLVLLIIGYVLLLWYYQTRQISFRLTTFLAALFFCCEFAMNFHCFVGAAADDDVLFAQTMSAADAFPEDADDPLARVRLTRKYAHANMVGAVGVPTLAHYTSMTREDVMHGVKRAGYSSYWMEINSTGGTVLSDALWHIRYLLGTHGDLPARMKKPWTDGRLALALNPDVLPSAFTLDAAPGEIAELPMGQRADTQRFLAEHVLGDASVITADQPVSELNGVTLETDENGNTVCTPEDAETEGEIVWHLFIPERQALYFDLYSQTATDLKTPRDGAVRVSVNGKTLESEYPMQNRNGLLHLGDFDGSYVTVRVYVKKAFTCESFGVFGIRMEPFEKALEAAEGCDVAYSRGVYTAEISADTEKTLVFSAAYDEGFTATVNGEPAEVFRVLDCMPAVRIPAGESRVVLTYHVCGLKPALLIALCGLLLIAVFLLCLRFLPERVLNAAGAVSVKLTHLAYGAVVAGVYCLPLVLWLIGAVRSLLH